ncbi:MAG: YraN family protein [Opitutales bacterium]|nr:YraN family protein [Opitutales bacterium]
MGLFGFLKNLFSPRKRQSLGRRAESAAAKFLKREKKLKIIARNYRSGRYEIDIICYDKPADTIVFAEVKCRPVYAKVRGYYSAASKKKSAFVRACARDFMRQNRAFGHSFRFDVVEVNHDGSGNIVEILHFENAG